MSALYVYFALKRLPLLARCFLVIGCFVLFSYISTPQLNLDLLPLFALVPLIPLPLFYIFEYSTTGFMVIWHYFPSSSFHPVVQAVATLRQISLAVILFVMSRKGYALIKPEDLENQEL